MTERLHEGRYDGRALDRLAELFRLPEWRIDDSASSFIEACAQIVESVRDINEPLDADTLRELGFDDLADELEPDNDDEDEVTP